MVVTSWIVLKIARVWKKPPMMQWVVYPAGVMPPTMTMITPFFRAFPTSTSTTFDDNLIDQFSIWTRKQLWIVTYFYSSLRTYSYFWRFNLICHVMHNYCLLSPIKKQAAVQRTGRRPVHRPVGASASQHIEHQIVHRPRVGWVPVDNIFIHGR